MTVSPGTTARARAAAAFAGIMPASRPGRILCLGASVDAIATGMFLAAATLYFVGFVGISAIQVGVALSIANICGLISPVPLGWLADRVGTRRVYLTLLLIRAVGYIGYVFVSEYRGYLVLTCLLTAASRACTPLLQVIVGDLEGARNRTQTMSSLRSVNNIGLTGGFLLASLVQAVGTRSAFAVLFTINGLAFLLVAYLTARAVRAPAGHADPGSAQEPAAQEPAAQEPAPTAPATPARAGAGRSPYRDGKFLVFTLANAILLLHDSILFILVPLWIVERAGLPATISSVLMSVNTVLTVVIQMRLARMDHGFGLSLRLLRRACVALVGSCVLFAVTDHQTAAVVVAGAAGAVVLLTIGENLHAVAGWELSFQMSTAAARTQYLALFSLSTTAQMIIGPVLITSVILPKGGIGWVLLAAGFTLATAVVWVVVRRYQSTLAGPPAVPPSSKPADPDQSTEVSQCQNT